MRLWDQNQKNPSVNSVLGRALAWYSVSITLVNWMHVHCVLATVRFRSIIRLPASSTGCILSPAHFMLQHPAETEALHVYSGRVRTNLPDTYLVESSRYSTETSENGGLFLADRRCSQVDK